MGKLEQSRECDHPWKQVTHISADAIHHAMCIVKFFFPPSQHIFFVYFLGSFLSYDIRRSLDDDKTDCIRLLMPLVTEKPVWDLFTKSQGKTWEQSLPVELIYLENAFCDLR